MLKCAGSRPLRRLLNVREWVVRCSSVYFNFVTVPFHCSKFNKPRVYHHAAAKNCSTLAALLTVVTTCLESHSRKSSEQHIVRVAAGAVIELPSTGSATMLFENNPLKVTVAVHGEGNR